MVCYTDRTQQRGTLFLVVTTHNNSLTTHNNSPTTPEPALVAKEVAKEGAKEVTHLIRP